MGEGVEVPNRCTMRTFDGGSSDVRGATTRRAFLEALGAAWAMLVPAASFGADASDAGLNPTRQTARPTPRDASMRRIPQRAAARVIVDNDFAGDPDALFALAHHLLAPAARTALVTTSGVNAEFAKRTGQVKTVLDAREIARDLIRRLGLPDAPSVVAGAEPGDERPSDAARAIVAEALREDPLPLYLACGGPLTNVAAALRLDPGIARRMTLIWIGGGAYPDGAWEYNLVTDLAAARHVVEDTTVPLWQVPQSTYRQMQYSIAEMEADLRPISPFTRWLYDHFTTPPDFAQVGGTWPMGDSPPVLFTALSTESSRYVDRAARRLLPDGRYGEELSGRSVRVWESVDARLVFADFLARLRLHAAGRKR